MNSFNDDNAQMTFASKYDLAGYSPILNLKINQNNNNNKKSKKRKSKSIDYNKKEVLKDDFKNALNFNIPESIMNLTQCFICLSIVENPLSCPECHNFACQKCLEDYFGNKNTKKCPICKQEINKKELTINKTVKKIKSILYQNNQTSKKITDLSNLFDEKKQYWENKNKDYLKDLLKKLFIYQEKLKEYKKEYEIFILNCQLIIKKTFEKYEKSVESFIKTILDIQKNNNQMNKMKKNNKKTDKNIDKNITTLVGDLLSMDRKYFNEEKGKKNSLDLLCCSFGLAKNIKELISMPILIMPNILCYSISFVNINKKQLEKGSIKKKEYNVHIGDYNVKYSLEQFRYSVLCQFSFKNNRNMSYFVTQKKSKDYSNSYEIIPMKLKSTKNFYTYETIVDIEEFKDYENININMETKIQIFSLTYNPFIPYILIN